MFTISIVEFLSGMRTFFGMGDRPSWWIWRNKVFFFFPKIVKLSDNWHFLEEMLFLAIQHNFSTKRFGFEAQSTRSEFKPLSFSIMLVSRQSILLFSHRSAKHPHAKSDKCAEQWQQMKSVEKHFPGEGERTWKIYPIILSMLADLSRWIYTVAVGAILVVFFLETSPTKCVLSLDREYTIWKKK